MPFGMFNRYPKLSDAHTKFHAASAVGNPLFSKHNQSLCIYTSVSYPLMTESIKHGDRANALATTKLVRARAHQP